MNNITTTTTKEEKVLKSKEKRKAYLKEYMKEYTKKIGTKEYYQKYKETIKRNTREYYYKEPMRKLFASTKITAKRKGLEHNLTVLFLKSILPKECPYLKEPFTYLLGTGYHPHNPSIDRIDSSKGYTQDNVQILSLLANSMKQAATPEQLQRFAMSILGIEEI